LIVETTTFGDLESYIISGCIADRSTYETARAFADIDGFSPAALHTLSIIGGYFDADGVVRSVPRGVISERASRLPDPRLGKLVSEFVRCLPEDVSGRNVRADIIEHRKHVIGGKLSLALANKTKDISELLKLYTEADSFEVGASVETLVDIFDTSDLESPEPEEKKICLAPLALNNRLNGGARRGHHLLVYGRPEVGKTLVAINLVAGFVKQKLRVLYVANEEPAADLRVRLRTRITSGPSVASQLTGFGSSAAVKIAPLAPGSFPQIGGLLHGGSYDVLVLDQLRNIRTGKASDTRTEALERAAIEARNLGKKHNVLVVSITQAGDSASGKAVLDMSDVDNSKTGIPGAVDLMLGVGATRDMQEAGQLVLSLPKNKLSGDHGSLSCSYNKLTGVIQSG
jgi:hypothetical protein